MLVRVLGFGTNWWARFGHAPADPHRFTRHAAYYNSTGIRCGSKVRRHWRVPGLIRFNGAGDFNPHRPESLIGKIFECPGLSFAFGGNRLLLERKAHAATIPDCFLIVVDSVKHGAIDLASNHWHSRDVRVIAASHLRLTQEVMLLMHLGDWIETSWGFWQLQFALPDNTAPRLELVHDPVRVEGI
jgi:hypothetical protein